METPHLATPEYWQSGGIELRLNPRRALDTRGLREFIVNELGREGLVVMATSGSTGAFKFVLLSKDALLASARAVAAHLALSGDDLWLAGLSNFHVGGLGIYARAFVTGAAVAQIEGGDWDRSGAAFHRALVDSRATWTSLTPTHLHDLVHHGVEATESLRGVLLGGGRIDPLLVDRAVALGWPIRASYGMTEASSQIATSLDSAVDWLPVIPGWATRLNGSGRLEIKGPALFDGYVMREEGKWTFDPARTEDGWFTTGDCVELVGDRLRFTGRGDDLIKISGELISLSSLEGQVQSLALEYGFAAALVALPDARREHELVVVFERGVDPGAFQSALRKQFTGLERISRTVEVTAIPTTAIGKVDRGSLRDSVTQS